MQEQIILGEINIPEQKMQKQLYQQLGEFAGWMQKSKDANEVKKDKRKSVPASMLPMVF